MSKQKDNKRTGKSLDKGKRTKPFGKDSRGKKPKEITQNKPSKPSNPSDGIRLNKYIANSGICSRREADMYIQVGSVSVNGTVVSEMGFKVKPNDEVKFDGRKISPEAKKYVLLNKPKGFATTTSDNKGNTVMDLVANASSIPLHPIGRLGRNATGLLLFTNDDDFMQKFTRRGVTRLFHIELDKNLKSEDIQRIKEGLKINGKTIDVEEVSWVNNAPKKEVGLKIKHIGNSVIRTIFDHLNYNVVKVDCVTIGPLTKKDLPRGRWRDLNELEMNNFSML
ncbi:MAG: rRNA pseudouridine synthase [Flavobacteriaceae bacterium]|jgi:23S rRNA pseudouridine2605 synthase|nr:rRNA pseudouridine synthase [Flavobacteriaceae bacterium]MBT3919033.1 rRNA pseudouridine synthase [Flavobacteriaceae bacterium]MBT6705037.1 rRNA pseudouridine synthase [Flavobacteriaceae bacterium]MBT7242134.1 rRNA pseudouridine synthase [Flavobacteriaceae bacterium]